MDSINIHEKHKPGVVQKIYEASLIFQAFYHKQKMLLFKQIRQTRSGLSAFNMQDVTFSQSIHNRYTNDDLH